MNKWMKIEQNVQCNNEDSQNGSHKAGIVKHEQNERVEKWKKIKN